MKHQKGFTLIELLIVIVIISILAAIIYIAIDPAERFAQARNARRRSEVVSILNAILHYQVDHNGTLPTGVDSDSNTSQVLGTAATGCDLTCGAIAQANLEEACLDLSIPAVGIVDKYLAAIPMDPVSGLATNTDYYVNRTAGGRIVVGACDPEDENGASVTISVTR